MPASAKTSTVPPGSTAASAVSTPPRSAEDGGVDGPVRRPPARAGRVDREDLVAAPLEHGPEQPPDEAVADRRARARAAAARRPRRTQASGSTYRPARSRPVVGQLDPAVGAHALGEAARHDRRLGKLLAGRLVPGRQRAHSPQRGGGRARRGGRPRSARRPRGRARSRGAGADLLDVRAAEPAGEDAHELARRRRARRRRTARARRPVEDDGAHRRIVGPGSPTRRRRDGSSSSIAARTCGSSSAAIRAGGAEGARRHGRRVRGREGAVAEPEEADGRDRGHRPERPPRRSSSRTARWYREESADMVEAIRAGKFGSGAPPAADRAPKALQCARRGAIAQLGERLDRTQEVSGSSPLGSIETPPFLRGFSVCGWTRRGCFCRALVIFPPRRQRSLVVMPRVPADPV